MATKKPSLSLNNTETLAEMSERYRILAQPKTIQMVMQKFTARMDRILKERLESLPTHPKDTGLLRRSWEMPIMYLTTHSGNTWKVYLNNSATVGKQAELKGKHQKIKRHNLKRYLKFVDKRTGFYTKQLRILKNKVDAQFKKFVGEVLWEANKAGFMSSQEMSQWNKEFSRL